MALVEHPVDPAEIECVMAFFRANKRPGHILGQDRDFLVWQLSPRRCRGFEQAGLSAVTLWDGGEIVGMLGVIGLKFNRDGAILDGGWLCNLIAIPFGRRLDAPHESGPQLAAAGHWCRWISL
jgi:hypothetical protein